MLRAISPVLPFRSTAASRHGERQPKDSLMTNPQAGPSALPTDAARQLPLVSRLSLEEKVRLLTGETAFTLPGHNAIGLSPLAFSDGPTGVRGLKFAGG